MIFYCLRVRGLASAVCQLCLLVSASCLAQALQVDHVAGLYNVVGEFTPIRVGQEGQRSVPHNYSCHDYARSIREPFSTAFQPRRDLDDLNTEARLAFWSWEGNISRALFDTVAQMPHYLHYKVIGRRIYRAANYTPASPPRQSIIEDIMRVAVHLYPLPDMEFLVHYADGSRAGHPVLNMCVERHFNNPGFTIPTLRPWVSALGPTQLAAYHGCLWNRYPPHRRKPLVVWRGSTTGVFHNTTLAGCLELPRVRLHMMSRQHPEILDTRVSNICQGPCGDQLRPLLNDTGSYVTSDDYNMYCAVVDIDGNSWSDRFQAQLVHQPTPVLKQATNITSFNEHFFAPGTEIELFDNGLDDFVEKARRMVEDCKLGEASKGLAMARRAQTAAAELLSNVGIIRSMAYALVNYRRLSVFEPNISTEGFVRLNQTCCAGSTLPPELLAALAAMDQAPS